MDWVKALAKIPPLIKTGYALMALAFLLFGYLAASGRLESNQVGLLIAGMFVAALACIFVLKPSQPIIRGKESGLARDTSPEICTAPIKDLVDSSQLPMYLLDNSFVVRHCNDAFISFLGVKKSDVIGKHVTSLIDNFAAIVPENRRNDFRNRQNVVIKEGQEASFAALSEIVDLGLRVSSTERRMFRVWIYAEVVRRADSKGEAGTVVRYHLAEVDRASGSLTVE